MKPPQAASVGRRASWRDLTRPNGARAITLSVIAALIGLVLAGAALFTAKGTSTLIVPAEDVAVVNQQPLSRSDFDYLLSTQFHVSPSAATRQQRQAVLDQMVREELFVQRSQELDVAAFDPELRSVAVTAVEQEIAADAVATPPPEQALQAYYLAHQDRYSGEGSMVARDLQFPKDAGGRAYAALKGGADADATLKALGGTDTGRLSGRNFYFAAKLRLGPQAFEIARSLGDRSVSAPMAEPEGVRLIYMVQNIKPIALPFAQARPQVLADYQHDAQVKILKADEGFFRRRANILVAKDLR